QAVWAVESVQVAGLGAVAAGAGAVGLVREGLAFAGPAPEGVGPEGVAPAALAVASAQDAARPAAAVLPHVAALRQSRAPEVREPRAPAGAIAAAEQHFSKAPAAAAGFAAVEV